VEICSTTTWIQLCAALHRLTGETVYMDELENALLNHLFGSVSPDCSEGAYFSSPNTGGHDFTPFLHCCNSSGPRALAVAVSLAYSTQDNGVRVNLYGDSRYSLRAGETEVSLVQRSGYPADGRATLTVEAERPAKFPLSLRIPAWAQKPRVLINGKVAEGEVQPGSYFVIDREWRGGDKTEIELPFQLETSRRQWRGQNICAYSYGPLVLAAPLAASPDGDNLPGLDGVDTDQVLPALADTRAHGLPSFRLPAAAGSVELEPYFLATSRGKAVATWFQG
jgi:DUF1680 family protein